MLPRWRSQWVRQLRPFPLADIDCAGIMTIMVEDTEQEQRKEEHHLQLKGEAFSANFPLDRLKRNVLHTALVPRSKQRPAAWNTNPEDKSSKECSPLYLLW